MDKEVVRKRRSLFWKQPDSFLALPSSPFLLFFHKFSTQEAKIPKEMPAEEASLWPANVATEKRQDNCDVVMCFMVSS